ncbi:MAG TPA: hypothetical protein VFG52_07010 [Xanthomonadales bacterium]|nr:hypothetical protein [Xanthomonadales bacterium]
MRDLFLQLNLDPNASSEDIAAAIKAKPLHEGAAEILLNERRRAAYQRTVSTLRSIGILRHRLGLDNDDTWFVQTCPDFAPRLHTRKFAAQPVVLDPEPISAMPPSNGKTSKVLADTAAAKAPSRGWHKPLLVAAVIAAVLILLAVLL